MPNFGNRLRGAMLAAGIESVSQLAREAGVSRQIAGRWLKMSETDLSAKNLTSLANLLHVRIRWLADGVGTPLIKLPHYDNQEEIATILNALSKEEVALWLRFGEFLLRDRQKQKFTS